VSAAADKGKAVTPTSLCKDTPAGSILGRESDFRQFDIAPQGAEMLHTRSYRVGLSRRRRSLFGWGLAGLGAVWLLVEPCSFLFPPFREFVEANNKATLAAFVLAAIGHAVWRAREPRHIAFRPRTTNTVIRVEFGDLFMQTGHLAIPVNEFFDGQLGTRVDDKSVHGQFIAKYYGSEAKRFEAACDAALHGSPSESVERPGGRCKKYVIGTTAVVPIGPAKAFLFALSETDLETSKARANLPLMWSALKGLWASVRSHSNGHNVSLPLVGAGQSSVGFEPQHLLRIVLLSALVATREREIARTITIVLHEDLFDNIDLRALHQEWS
jgi:hypothetical protein